MEFGMLSSAAARCRVLLLVVTVGMGSGLSEAQQRWELVSKTPLDEISIAPDSLLAVSQTVVSVWVQHRGANRSLVAERQEVNCATQQRRVVELWTARDRPDSAPTALRQAEWLRTEPKTPMREFVERVCEIRRRNSTR